MRLFNTLTRSKEEVGKPLDGSALRVYTCGLTVYSHPHIGNWSAYIYWDVLHRTLLQNDYTVNRVQNITDVGHLVSDDDHGEDKLEKAAAEEKVTAWDIAQKYSKIALDEAKQLNLMQVPLVAATDRINEQIALVDTLTSKNLTYELEDGIYFDTSQFETYVELAKIDIEGLESGKRVADSGKRNPTDFAVWKFTPEGQTRDMQWEYPVGSSRMGFPGWHLECSAIAMSELGEQIDIHTGGIDHIPVHHSNEIAQSESATNKQFSRFWIHNNHMKIDNAKLAKSDGNGVYLSDASDAGYGLEAFKLLVLTSHYRSEGNFTWDILKDTQNRLKRWQEALRKRPHHHPEESVDSAIYETHVDQFKEALANDLDTPGAIAVIEQLLDIIEDQTKSGKNTAPMKEQVVDLLRSYFGIAQNWHIEPIVEIEISLQSGEVVSFEQLLQMREKARTVKDWDSSDTLRNLAEESGIIIEDMPKGQVYYRQV